MKTILLAIITLACVSDAHAVGSAVSSAIISSASSTASAYHVFHNKNPSSDTGQINNAKLLSDKTGSVTIPCKVHWIPTGFFEKDDNRVDIQKTYKSCEEDKQILEQLNGTKYKFGNATMYDSYNKKVYIELIKE
jgi:hypothetical protein